MTVSTKRHLAAIFMLALSTGAATADEIAVQTARGLESVQANPEILAVLDIAAIDTIAALGIEIDGVPSRLYLDYLEPIGATATPVGTLHEPDLEALAVLAPDMILAGGRSSPAVDTLARLAPTLDMTIAGDDAMTVAFERLETYGQLFGAEAEAASLASSLRAKQQRAQAAVSGKGDALIILANGPKISAYGKESRFGWLHNSLDLPEAHEGISTQTHGEAVSFEFLAEVNPDWLIVVDRGAAIGAEGAAAAETLDNELVRSTFAWEKGQVVYVDPAAIYIAGGGVQATERVLDDIIAGFTK